MTGLKKWHVLLLGLSFPVTQLFAQAGISATDGSRIVDSTDTTVTVIKPVTPTPVPRRTYVKRPKPIRTELSGGLRLNSDGWSIFADKGWVVSEDRKRDYFYDVRLFQVELGEKKHPKEIKRTNTPGFGSDQKPKPFIYGKVNNFYNFKLGYGARKMIAGKPEYGSVSVHWMYLGGFTAGLLKPYYLNTTRGEIKYSDTTAETFLSRTDIFGSSSFSRGLGELSIVPGIHAKTALHFDFAKAKKTKIAVETGINAELYSKKIELMALQDAVPYFINIYASIQFGKRWQ